MWEIVQISQKMKYTLVGNMRFTECSPRPETHFKPILNSGRGKLMFVI